MIKTGIAREYPNHTRGCQYSDKTLYLADYSTKTLSRRGVVICEETPPPDINSFELTNGINLLNGYIKFGNKSFTRPDGSPLPQCECVVFPESSTTNSWILFAELKHGEPGRNDNNIRKAIQQLYKTRTYYKIKGIFSRTNTCYLVVSLPEQSEPYAQSVVSPVLLQRLKKKHNVILGLRNQAEIRNDKMINI